MTSEADVMMNRPQGVQMGKPNVDVANSTLTSECDSPDQTSPHPVVSVVIPVYRSEGSLPPLIERLGRVFAEMQVEYEVVLVDDASPDNSWQVMQELRYQDPRVKIIQHMRNFGQHKAILCGMEHARGRFVVTMDDDLQHPPEEIPKLFEALTDDDETDVIIGAYESKQHSWFRNMGSWAVNRVSDYVFAKDPNLKLTSFRIMRRSVVEELGNTAHHNPRIGQLLLLITNRIKNVQVVHNPQENGSSRYRLSRLVPDALDHILSNSALPLQMVSYLGFGCSILSFVMITYYLYRFFFIGVGVPGWTTTILLLLFFFGMVLFSLGVVGEYLIRILKQVQHSPRSIVRKKKL